MPNDVKEKLENRKKEIEAEFEKIQGQIKQTSKSQSELQAKLVQLQGAYQEVTNLLEEPKEEPKKEKPKK